MSSIMVVDILGFQDPSACGRPEGGTFRDLCDNYVQERLQHMFHESTFTSQQDKYAQVMTRNKWVWDHCEVLRNL